MSSTATARALLAGAVLQVWAAGAAQPPPAPPTSPPSEPAPPMTPAAEPSAPVMSARHAEWLLAVDALITAKERALFRSLVRDYQRDAFIEKFWRVRDPHQRTARNELKERWPERVAQAKSEFGRLDDDRSRILLVHGRPASGFRVRCTTTRQPAEVWVYHGSDMVDQDFLLVFVQPRPGEPTRLWRPGSFAVDAVLRQASGCVNGRRLLEVVSAARAQADEYDRLLQVVLVKPKPRSLEWVDTFVAFSTDLDDDAEPLPTTLEVAFPGRYGQRTVVQGLLTVPAGAAGVVELAGYRSHELQLTGEVLKDGTLFESFRYKFTFPVDEGPGSDSPAGDGPAPGRPAADPPSSIPLSFERLLRPGEYTLIVKVDDLNSAAAFRAERALTVPRRDEVLERPVFDDPRTAELFAEATAAVAAGETRLRLIPPRDNLLSGFVRFDTLVTGDEIEKVRFYLDDTPRVTRNRPPYNVEIDLGPYPDLHTLRAVGLDAAGAEVASDELLLNSGGYRFSIRLVEPRRGGRYERSLRARAEVNVPENRSLDRVEVFLDEHRVATLYQEPWEQAISLPPGEPIGYVRAVAYLADGNSTEDLVFINAPDYLDELEIQFVELYTTVLDEQGRPVEGLEQADFRVAEDGVPQQIRRFERVENLPIHVGILIDNSASMHGILEEVRRAALSFFGQAITAKDRAAVITFNSFPHLAVELTNDRRELGAGLAGLVAEGQTALYDSVMFGLYYFTGIKGQRAILVLSDGKDESSRFDFDQTLEYARRAGVTLYTIGLRLGDGGARTKLERLADETGGRAFFIRDIGGLEEIYGQIQRELRSQYLIAYQSSNTSGDDELRLVDLRVDRPRVTVKTLTGYYH